MIKLEDKIIVNKVSNICMCLLISIPKCIELNSESKPKQIIKGTILYFEQIFDMAIGGMF